MLFIKAITQVMIWRVNLDYPEVIQYIIVSKFIKKDINFKFS